MRLIPSLASLAFVVASAGCVLQSDSSILVENRSDFEIHELYVTPVASSSWGPNLVNGDALYPGDSMWVGLDCGTFDALIIDETGAECEVNDVDLCLDDANWIITNRSCALFEARAKAAAAAK